MSSLKINQASKGNFQHVLNTMTEIFDKISLSVFPSPSNVKNECKSCNNFFHHPSSLPSHRRNIDIRMAFSVYGLCNKTKPRFDIKKLNFPFLTGFERYWIVCLMFPAPHTSWKTIECALISLWFLYYRWTAKISHFFL